ncbi:unnamed protein product, partial [Vitis vinifera]
MQDSYYYCLSFVGLLWGLSAEIYQSFQLPPISTYSLSKPPIHFSSAISSTSPTKRSGSRHKPFTKSPSLFHFSCFDGSADLAPWNTDKVLGGFPRSSAVERRSSPNCKVLDLLDFKWLTNRLLEKKVDLTILFSNPFCTCTISLSCCRVEDGTIQNWGTRLQLN